MQWEIEDIVMIIKLGKWITASSYPQDIDILLDKSTKPNQSPYSEKGIVWRIP